MGTLFKLKFPMVEDITDRITYLNSDCLLYKIDLQKAFHHLKLDPGDINRTVLQYMGHYYVDTAVPFGYRHGSVCMQRVTDSLRCIMHKKGYLLTNYMDDLIGCDKPELAIKDFKFLTNVIIRLGQLISESKLYKLQKYIPCLGINVNIDTGFLS